MCMITKEEIIKYGILSKENVETEGFLELYGQVNGIDWNTAIYDPTTKSILSKEQQEELGIAQTKSIEPHYCPEGKRMQVRDMTIGHVYCFADMSLEDYDPRFKVAKEKHHFIDNVGLLQISVYEGEDLNSKYVMVRLDPVSIEEETNGKTFKKTGYKIWKPEPYYRIFRKLALDDEVVEARPFPVAVKMPSGEIMSLPNPEVWKNVSSDTPHTKKEDHVNTWDEDDIIKLLICGALTPFLIYLGELGAELCLWMWLLVGIGIHRKHKEIKEYVLWMRKQYKIRGDGMDDRFLWRR